MDAVVIRAAELPDAEVIATIYNVGIEERQATFETRTRTPAEVAQWFELELPFIVAEQDGVVVGFARVGPYSEREAYAGIGEHGVYLAPSARGRGLGRRLLVELCGEARRYGMHKLTSRIFTTNAASLAAHRAAGFSEVGILRRHARLDGEWRDCVLVEVVLD